MKHDTFATTDDQQTILRNLNDSAVLLGRTTVDIGGFLSELSSQCHGQTQALTALRSGSASVVDASDQMQDSLAQVLDTAQDTLQAVERSMEVLAGNAQQSTALADWVRAVHDEGTAMETMLAGIRKSNDQIGSIASQVTSLR